MNGRTDFIYLGSIGQGNRAFCVGWSGRLEQSPTAHSFRTYIINVLKHAQDTSFLAFLLHLLTVSRVPSANIVRRPCSNWSHVTAPHNFRFIIIYYYYSVELLQRGYAVESLKTRCVAPSTIEARCRSSVDATTSRRYSAGAALASSAAARQVQGRRHPCSPDVVWARWLTTAAGSPTLAQQDCARLTLVRFSSVGRAPILATEPSVQLDLQSSTVRHNCSDSSHVTAPYKLSFYYYYYYYYYLVCRETSNSRTCHRAVSDSDNGTKAQCETFSLSTALYTLTHSHTHTYLISSRCAEFGVFPVSYVIDMRNRKFLVKYDLSDNLLR